MIEMAVVNEFYSRRQNYDTRKNETFRFRFFSQAYLEALKIKFGFKLNCKFNQE